jgi:hypothetical protein
VALICAVAPANADKRVALVIGNDRYANLAANEQLQKAVNDARAVGGALKQIGFDVISGENLGRLCRECPHILTAENSAARFRPICPSLSGRTNRRTSS